ncbi:MAG: sulfur carrier protein ThiS adenylyltransferase ThiF [Candidatus Fermentibacteria bacterium]|nr:sulfur carrier protein ThiS adenylyltransferase ThiF [Candidatus Fermentibacteria bacterium]
MKLFRDCPDGLVGSLSKLRVGITGAGGIGSNVAMLLVRAGVSSLVIVDYDSVEIQNLNRQFFFADQVNMPKVEALVQNLQRINDAIDVETHIVRLTPGNACDFFRSCDILVEAVDDAETKTFLIEEWSTAFPEKQIISCSGIAGTSPLSEIRTERTGKLSVVGDHYSPLELGTFSARVMAVAAHMVAEIQSSTEGGKCASCAGCIPGGVSLLCNEEKIPLIGFPARMIENTVRGMISSLKGADSSGSIKIELPVSGE